jgi:hypothetical protein
VRQQLAVNVCLPDSPRDQLAVLRAEVEDRDGIARRRVYRQGRLRGWRATPRHRLGFGDLQVLPDFYVAGDADVA